MRSTTLAQNTTVLSTSVVHEIAAMFAAVVEDSDNIRRHRLEVRRPDEIADRRARTVGVDVRRAQPGTDVSDVNSSEVDGESRAAGLVRNTGVEMLTGELDEPADRRNGNHGVGRVDPNGGSR